MKGGGIGVSLTAVYSIKKLKNKNRKSLLKRNIGKLETPRCICRKGSLTVEASLLLPLLACFFTFILFFFRILQVQLTVQEALEDTGRILAVMAEGETAGAERKVPSYYLLAKTSLYKKLGKDRNVERYVAGGVWGMTLLTSDWEKDYLVLEVNYAVRFPVNLLGRHSFWMTQRTSFRKWTGWHAVRDTDVSQMMVYITENGVAFHRWKSCPFLSLSIKKVKKSETGNLRNDSGAKYKRCGNCGTKNAAAEEVYITRYGECYHTDVFCSGLKRTIYRIHFSETGGKHACPKCWK